MKTSANKNTDSKHSASNSFFNKGNKDSFFSADHDTSFFPGPEVLQTKLSVGAPNDSYEQEADRMADQIVNNRKVNHTENNAPESKSASIRSKPLAQQITPLIRRKPAFESPSVLDQEAITGEENLQEKAEGALQKKPAFESPSPLDKDMGNTSKVPIASKDEEEDHSLQMQSDAPNTVPSGFESQLQSSKGKGASMDEDTKTRMESGFGTDFSDVRVHTDNDAVQMNRDLNAQAFTHGDDIYFNQGKYEPGTKSGDHLLAHELTHTVQQGQDVAKSLQRQTAPTNTNLVDKFDYKKKGMVDKTSSPKKITIPFLKVPTFKKAGTKAPLTLPKEKRSNKQREDWDAYMREKMKFEDKLKNKMKGKGSPDLKTANGDQIHVLKLKALKGKKANYVIGNKTIVRDKLMRPFWNSRGKRTFYHVDHIHEYQLGGADREVESNMWLLQADANTSSGRNIKKEKDSRINKLIDAASGKGAGKIWRKRPSLEKVKKQYTITFKEVRGGLSVRGKTRERYSIKAIRDDIKPLDGLDALTSKEIDKLGLLRSDVLTIFTNKAGGGMHKIKDWDQTKGEKNFDFGLGINLDAKKITYKEGVGGKVHGMLFRKKGKKKNFIKEYEYSFDVKPMLGIPYAGYIDNSSVFKELKEELELVGLSPIKLTEVSLAPGKGLTARGKVLPSIPIIKDADIDLVIDGKEIYLEKQFSSGEFKVPEPFKIHDSTLLVQAGTKGLKFEGGVLFEIKNVGEGGIKASVNSKGDFKVKGHFDFDKKLFDNARVEVSYENEQWSVVGTLKIPKKKVKGIKQASAEISYTEGNLSASGKVEPDIKGVKEGTIDLKYTKEEFSITGALKLSDEIPRLKSGDLSITVGKKAGEEGYSVSGKGSAVFDIPGIDSSLNVVYDNGLLTIEAEVAFEKGIAKGKVKAGATNRPVDEEGNPTGEAGKKWIIYGSGELTLRLTKWLEATARVKFLPNGEMEVTGRIALPSVVEVFSKKSYDKNLFSIPQIEIPIFAIPVGPKSIGLVATINGGLDFNAHFGPGKLENLFGEVTYNPSRPEETAVSAGGRFVIPAGAGLTLRADLGLGVSVGFASLTGGIEIAGTLGLEGEAAAEVDVNWSPKTGLELKAQGSVMVNPKFTFDVNLLARAKVNLPWPIPDIKKTWRKNLASFSWGPDIKFGIIFPIHYKEGEPFDVSLDDIQVIKPDINIGKIAKGLGKEMKKRVF